MKVLVTSPMLLSPASGSPDLQLTGPVCSAVAWRARLRQRCTGGSSTGLVKHPLVTHLLPGKGVVLPRCMPEKLEALRG